MSEQVTELGRRSRLASRRLASASTAEKDAALLTAADLLVERTPEILAANAADTEHAADGGMEPGPLDRLRLSERRIADMADGLRKVAALPDPVGELLDGWVRPNGLEIQRVRVPLGVVAVIYENRPNVTSDAAGICLKSGNAALLRGSSTALGSIRDNATVPVIIDGDGNCHVYVDAQADLDEALRITVNAKTNRTSVCNAAESLVVHEAVADSFLPRACAALAEHGVELVGDDRARALWPAMGAATDDDFAREFLAMKISIAVVDSLDAAIS